MNLLPTLPDFNQVLSVASPAKLVRGIGQSFADVLHSATKSAATPAPPTPAASSVGAPSTPLAAQEQLAATVATTPGKSVSIEELRTQAERALGDWEQTFAERL